MAVGGKPDTKDWFDFWDKVMLLIVVRALLRMKNLLPLDQMKMDIVVNRQQQQNKTFYAASLEKEGFTKPKESSFEKLWTRAAYERGNLRVLRVLLYAGFLSYYLFQHAIEYDDPELCTILFANGYTVDGNTETKYTTLLCMAARCGSMNVAKLLVSMGAKVYGFDVNGISPLHVAIVASQIDMIRFLASVGDPILLSKCPNVKSGVTPLSLAASLGNIKLVKILLSSGADIHRRDFDKSTLLHVAARNNSLEVLQFVTESWTSSSGLNVDRGSNRSTPLLDAVRSQVTKMF
ncbi:hypothetical protein HDU76_003337 [Blyttiomyces sp. JEL0837]|nr:hypothetical protein HDU76_003337 [Blyttiomyces sp. JEL0837]